MEGLERMTQAEWRKLFTKLRTLRWIVRMKEKVRQDETAYGSFLDRGKINYGMMTSQRQRRQYIETMNDLGDIIYNMDGGNVILKGIIYALVCGVWQVSTNYPEGHSVYNEEFTKMHLVWDELHTQRNLLLDFEKMGRALPVLDKILDSKPKNYANQIMMLKLSL